MNKIEKMLNKASEMKRLLEMEYEYKLKHESVDEIFNAMFGTDENNKEIKTNPICHAIYTQLKITTRKNIELEKEVRKLRFIVEK